MATRVVVEEVDTRVVAVVLVEDAMEARVLVAVADPLQSRCPTAKRLPANRSPRPLPPATDPSPSDWSSRLHRYCLLSRSKALSLFAVWHTFHCRSYRWSLLALRYLLHGTGRSRTSSSSSPWTHLILGSGHAISYHALF